MSDIDVLDRNVSTEEAKTNSSNQTFQNDWMRLILQKEITERVFDPVTEAILVLCFSMLITFGAIGNGLVIFVVSKTCFF